MYRTIVYLDTHELKCKKLVLKQDYIDFNMRERFNGYDEFIEYELSKYTDTGFRLDGKHYNMCVCRRPYVVGNVNKLDAMRMFLDGFCRVPLNSDDFIYQDNNYHFNQAYDLINSLNMWLRSDAKSLQNRGLKSVLKKLHYHHSYTIVNQMLNDKILEHETS